MRLEGPNGEELKCKKKASEVKVRTDTVPMVKRPSLEVEREVHDNLMPRLQAHVGRMCSWDLRKLSPERRVAFSGAILDLSAAFARVSAELTMLESAGFVAKTTEATRMSSRLPIGTKVRLREDKFGEFRQVYSDEQLNSLAVAKKTDTHVLLIAADGTNIGLVKFCQIDLEEGPTP
jgi:hypothetical protein